MVELTDSDAQGEEVLKIVPSRAGLPYQTEMLFEHYKQQRYAKVPVDQHHTRKHASRYWSRSNDRLQRTVRCVPRR